MNTKPSTIDRDKLISDREHFRQRVLFWERQPETQFKQPTINAMNAAIEMIDFALQMESLRQ